MDRLPLSVRLKNCNVMNSIWSNYFVGKGWSSSLSRPFFCFIPEVSSIIITLAIMLIYMADNQWLGAFSNSQQGSPSTYNLAPPISWQMFIQGFVLMLKQSKVPTVVSRWEGNYEAKVVLLKIETSEISTLTTMVEVRVKNKLNWIRVWHSWSH